MFRIGEFSHIARVSTRLLRFYAELGLLQPDFVDPDTGYRYYRASQLPRLNRILALKDIGLSLDEIAGLVEREVSPAELRQMLVARRSDVEQEVKRQQARLRSIETRIDAIDVPAHEPIDLVERDVDARPFLSIREVCRSLADGVELLGRVAEAAAPYSAKLGPPSMAAVWKADYDDADFDVEVGLLGDRLPQRLELDDGLILTRGIMPAARVVSTVRVGPPEFAHRIYGSVGRWLDTHDRRLAGEIRELVLEIPDSNGRGDSVVELEFPIM
jgi:DNA-binding transcriptional MerR regulator